MPTYLFIDDDFGRGADPKTYSMTLEKAVDGLTITRLKPSPLPELIQAIAGAKPDGLLLDVAFTNALDKDNRQVGFDGIALAQQVRTLQTRGRSMGSATLPEFPIVRFSKKDVIREYVSEDPTSDDLFDEMVDKGDVVDAAPAIAKRLIALASDYPKLVPLSDADAGDQAVAAALGCESDFLSRLDTRTLLGMRRPGAPAHALARYFTAKFLARPGAVISEELLAVRLGVDKARSGDWSKLLTELEEIRYVGLFSSGYARWWQARLQDWWLTRTGSETLLQRLDAATRVAALVQATGLPGLIALPEDADSPGTRFWHRCSRSERPVDPSQGFPLLPLYGHETWQDAEYLCLEEARRDSRNPRLTPNERARLAALMKSGKSA